MVDLVGYIIAGIPGLLIGVATLPWRHRVDPKGTTGLYLYLWTCFWPFFLVHFFWFGLLAYRKPWWTYLDRTRAARSAAQQQPSDAFPDFPARRTVKETYFKQKDHGLPKKDDQ